MKDEDQDQAFEQDRQRRIDAMTVKQLSDMIKGDDLVVLVDRTPEQVQKSNEFWTDHAKQARFGGALKKADWIQKSVHRDPRPDLPFEDAQFNWDQTDKYIAIGIVCVVTGLIIIAGAVFS